MSYEECEHNWEYSNLDVTCGRNAVRICSKCKGMQTTVLKWGKTTKRIIRMKNEKTNR